jgi:hypothetical protein
MASVATQRPPLSRLYQTPASAWISPPTRYWQRAAAYLLLALPLIGLALWSYYRGYTFPELSLLEHRAAEIKAGGANLAGLRYGYPPLPILLLLALPANPLAPSIVTCLSSAVLLGYVITRLLRRTSVLTVIVLVLPIVAVPVMWFATTEYFAPVGALAFLAVALDGFIRFAAHGETDGGFVAGIALALSLCCDPGALMYGLVMCAFAPLISHSRYQGARSIGAIAAVLFFPIVIGGLGWLFVVWKFSGTFPGSLNYEAGAHLLSFPSGVAAALWTSFKSVVTDLLHVPLYLAAVVLLCYRRRGAVPGLVLPLVALVAALWLGFVYSSVDAYLLLTVLALVTISDITSRRFEPALAAVALAQLALAFAWPLSSVNYSQWVHMVL